ncbi:hypothetical protein QCN28_21800 [Bordetella bronchiseptica]|uniref:hypothetical protein n=1 Tax=Bordetella bronchiseptica TaxID=518 RepID=UPI003F7471AA
MFDLSLLSEVKALLLLLKREQLATLGAIPWAAPVVAFGNPKASKVATVGLNPSNLEFLDREGSQLLETSKRFESLHSLRLKNWGQARSEDIERIWKSCEDYFFRNPYDQWFKRLDRLLVETGASYYNRIGTGACHLDLVPFATAHKWSALSSSKKSRLIELGVPSLVRTLCASDVRVLVLNGASVVREFRQLLVDNTLIPQDQPTWSLQKGRVRGISYKARISNIRGTKLNRDLLVLGFNHNIQSSFGVTTQVVTNIAKWIGDETQGTLT